MSDEACSLQASANVRYLARQPILDAREQVFGYELLFRGGAETLFSAMNSDKASLSTMDYSLALSSGTLTAEKPVFINCTRELLTTGMVTLLPPDRTVLEILEDIEPDEEVVAACRRLRGQGYRLALDDLVEERLSSPLLEVADYAKVDLRANDSSILAGMAKRLAHIGVTPIAEKVETREEFEAVYQAGYRYFQGYFFCRPLIVKTQDITPTQQSHLRLLHVAHDRSLQLSDLEQIIRSDVSLCYRLLRYLNSAAFGLYPVQSIRHALVLLGEHEIRKWMALVTTALLAKGKTPELLRIVLTRAKFCEAFAPEDRREDYFLVGLLSLLDAMLSRPMEQLVSELPISQECRTALLGGDNSISQVLLTCRACEKAEVESGAAEQNQRLWQSFTQANSWADSVLSTTL